MSTALQSEERAFESLYRLHRPLVYAYALSTLRHPADAEDVTQTTFLNAYCALHRGVTPRDTPQWLLAITRNACRDRFREAKRRPKEEPLNDWIRLVQPETPDYSVEEVVKEISALNPRYRQILLMREFEGRSYAEISTQLGVSEAAVQTLLARARRALRDELELGMTCTQARRVALRDLNGVAVLDERRALKRHLRRCADCAAFVGRRPRTPVAQVVWIATMPFRRIWNIMVGASAVPAASTTTSAGAGAVATKLITMTMVGTAAVGVTGVTVKQISTERTIQPRRTPPVHLPVVAHAQPVFHAPVTVSPQSSGTNVSSDPPAHADAVTPPVPEVPQTVVTGAASVVVPPATDPVATSAPTTPAAPQTMPAAGPQTTPAAAPATVPAQPTAEQTAPAAPQASSLPSGATSADGALTPAPSVPSTAPSAASDADDATPASAGAGNASDPGSQASDSAPGSPFSGPGLSNGNHTAVGPDGTPPGQGGTPPGQAAKAAEGAHGHQ